MNVLKMTDQDLTAKRVLIREDLNVPVKDGVVTSDARIRAALPTIKAGIDAGARVMLMSHLGRPKEGAFESVYSLAPVAEHLGSLLNQRVRLVADWLDGLEVDEGQVVLCENVRFNVGEKADDEGLSHYFETILPHQFDSMIYIDTTSAVVPLSTCSMPSARSSATVTRHSNAQAQPVQPVP